MRERKDMQELKNWKENFEGISGSGSAFQFDHAFNSSSILNVELREVLATPRKMPRQLREEIAAILIYEFFSGKEYEIKDEKLFMSKFGVFYPMFLNIRNLEGWADLKALARANSMAGIFILRTLLDEFFSLLDNYEKEPHLQTKFSKNPEKVLAFLRKLIRETYSAWENKELREIEKNFLRNPDNETQENLDQQLEKTTGSERLASMTQEFIFSDKAGDTLDSTFGEKLAAKIEGLIPVLEEHLDMLEILSMLFPGKMWDQSLRSLHREYFGNLEKYAAILRKRADLREILEKIGRIELEYGSKKLSLSPYSRSEVHTVTFSGDIQTLLPIEAVKLKNSTLKLKFYADMLEGKLLTYQLRGENWNSDTAGKRRKGPVIALVDTSASMRGIPESFSKAVMLAITRRMLNEGRDVKVILFSSKWQTFEIELTDKKRMGQEFLEFLKFTFGGGTDFNTALRAGLKTMKGEKAFEGADILFLTDGASEVSEVPLIREWKEVKAERKARIFSLIIGSYDAGGLEQISDHTYFVGDAGNWEVIESPASFVKAISRPVRF
jgi:uncharacterized protein with von Willebrand factor type A (vWA) domain